MRTFLMPFAAIYKILSEIAGAFRYLTLPLAPCVLGSFEPKIGHFRKTFVRTLGKANFVHQMLFCRRQKSNSDG